MDIENLRAFLAVVDDGHFGAAADRLRVPQPTLSRRIQRLEAEAGHRLLIRTARPVAPTPAGRLLTPHARAAVEAADRATAAMRALADGHGAALRVGYVQSATFGAVPRLLAAARRRDIQVELVAAPTIRQVEALRDHRLDAGLLRPASAAGGLGDLCSAALSRDPLFAVLADAHPLARHRHVRPAQLAGRRLVLYPEHEGPGLRGLVTRWLAAYGVEPAAVQDAWDAPSAAMLAAAGAGVALLPGPLPPLPAGARARRVAGSPRIELVLAWHPAAEAAVRPLAGLLGDAVAPSGGTADRPSPPAGPQEPEGPGASGRAGPLRAPPAPPAPRARR